MILNKKRPKRIYNEVQRAGFRDLRECNRNLLKGPDFGGDVTNVGTTSVYLPAYQRYSGRFFISHRDLHDEFWDDVRNSAGSVEVVMLSGLYGVLLWDEMIQEYDCYIGDYLHFEGKARMSLAEYWRKTLTKCTIRPYEAIGTEWRAD